MLMISSVNWGKLPNFTDAFVHQVEFITVYANQEVILSLLP